MDNLKPMELRRKELEVDYAYYYNGTTHCEAYQFIENEFGGIITEEGNLFFATLAGDFEVKTGEFLLVSDTYESVSYDYLSEHYFGVAPIEDIIDYNNNKTIELD